MITTQFCVLEWHCMKIVSNLSVVSTLQTRHLYWNLFYLYQINSYAIVYIIITYSDIQKIEEGIGRNFSTFIQEMSSMVASFVIAFVFNWQLALVTSVLLPVLLVMLGVLGKVSCSLTSVVSVNYDYKL